MKKFLLALLLGYSVSALAQTEPQPYYFSDELKNAIKNCTPYSEDLYEKNPDMKKKAESMMRMFFGEEDFSMKMLLTIHGMQEDKCQIAIKYDNQIVKKDYQIPMIQEFMCFVNRKGQDLLIDTMNGQSVRSNLSSIDQNDDNSNSEFDSVVTEIVNSFCEPVKYVPSEEKIQQIHRKMMAFSDKFKNSLKNCAPDITALNIVGSDLNKLKIIGRENDLCHITTEGFHVLLSEKELSISGFDELGEILSDEKRVTYSPAYRYEGTLFALNECVFGTNLEDDFFYRYHQNKGKFTFGKNIQISYDVGSRYEKNICQVLISLSLEKNGHSEDYSLRCDVGNSKISEYLKPYSSLIQQYGPKIEREPSGFSITGRKQTDEVSKADEELFFKLYKDGLCKKLSEFPPENSEGCSFEKPLKNKDGECFSCDDARNIKNEKECEKICNGFHGRNRRVRDRGGCILETCPKEKILRGFWGDCYSCDYPDPINDDVNSCSLCKNRIEKGGKCIPDNYCKNRPLEDIDGMCYLCDTEEYLTVQKGKCKSVCPNRVEEPMDDSDEDVYCTLKERD